MVTRRLLLIFACSIFIIASSGCTPTITDSGTIETDTFKESSDDISGTYKLISVNGTLLPGTVFHDATQIKIYSGVFKFDAAGNCRSESVFGPPSGGKVNRKVDATYTRNGTSLFMQWKGAGTTTGTIEDGRFTMDNHGMIFVYSRSGQLDDNLQLGQASECDQSIATTSIKKAKAGVFDGFDSGLPYSIDPHGIPLGFFPFQDSARTSVNISTTSEHPQRPGEGDNNKVLQLDLDVEGWAGVIHHFENSDVNSWAPRNWHGYKEFSFWLYGNNSDTSLFVEIIDNRNPCSTSSDGELYTYTFTDNFSGWKLITVPFDKLARKDIGNGAPNDGLGLSEVHGWVFGTLNTGGPSTYYIDDFELR